MTARAFACSVVCLLACAPGAIGCAGKSVDEREQQLAELERWEQQRRESTDWRKAKAGDTTLGPDPVAVVELGAGRFAVALRGADAVIVVDDSGAELQRMRAPRAPRDLSVADNVLYVVGELAPHIARFPVGKDGALGAELAPIAVPGAFGLSGVASGSAPAPVVAPPGAPTAAAVVPARAHVVHVVDPVRGALLTLDLATDAHDQLDALPIARGALFARRTASFVAAMSPEAHVVVTAPVDARGVPDTARASTYTSNGPVWSLALREVGGDLLVAIGMAEDHPLDRTRGSFDYIDSFVRVEKIAAADGAHTRVADINVGAHGVVMPKAIVFLDDDTLDVTGAGSGGRALVRIGTGAVEAQPKGAPGVVARAGDRERTVAVNVLLDRLETHNKLGDHSAFVGGAPPRDPMSVVGEALLFSTLIAPQQSSEGALSRFTCETCHFEGHGDGRTHDTGRMAGDMAIHATTKPLSGLANDVPLFTRALDPNLTRMAHAEFRVANAGSSLDPWFAVRVDDAPWLADVGVKGTLSPIELRKALVGVLFELRPRTNARVVGRDAFTELERAGAAVFRAQCVSCHAARLIGNDTHSEVPFELWERLVLADHGPIVWSRDGYEKTGVLPYVHESGARPSSLRRIEKKQPYFTNGSAQSLADVVARFRVDGATRLHAGEGAPLSTEEQRALLAFLVLL